MKKTKPKPVEQQPLSPYLNEHELRVWQDYEWCMQNAELREKHAGKVVIVHQQKVWAVGKNYGAAWEAARRKRGCPPKDEVAFVPLP